jgi:hypothetical protein
MQKFIPYFIYVFVVCLLPGLILATGFVRKSSVKSQKVKLTDMKTSKNSLAETSSFKMALAFFESIPANQISSILKGFKLPITILIVIILLFSYTMSLVRYPSDFLNEANYFLGGTYILNPVKSETLSIKQAISQYQAGTLITMIFAFIGAYLVILARLFRRINNYDIDPMAYYFFSLHIIQAVLVAAVLRHTFYTMNGTINYMWLATFGFSVGLKPDLFMQFIVEKGIAFAGRTKGQTEIDPEKLPSIMPLSMIEGLTEEKRLRLRELNIDNSQALAKCNPIFLWVRTSFQLLPVIDWIAQAQLYILVENDRMQKLRLYGIRDIFSFMKVAGSPDSKIANFLNIDQVDLGNLVKSIEETPAFLRLQEVNRCLASS